MGDPLSVAASIAGLLSLANDLAGGLYACYKYYNSVKEARGQIRETIDKLKALRTQLQDLESIYMSASQPLPSTKQVLDTVKRCSKDIVDFSSLLDPDLKGVKGMFRQLTWPAKKENVNSFLSNIQLYHSLFASAQQSDTLRLTDKAVSLGKQIAESIDLEKDRATKARQSEAWQQLLDWLSPLDLQKLENLHNHTSQTRRTERSGHWILRERKFTHWRDSRKGHVWFYGDPGVGKTILISDIIDHCLKVERKSHSFHVAYFYCNFQADHLQTLEYILGSLLKQLLSKNFDMMSAPKLVLKIYERAKDPHMSLRTLKPLMNAVFGSLKHVHIIIDGLDEVSPETQSTFVELFKLSETGRKFDQVSLLICSRPHIQGIQAAEKLQIAAREDDVKAMIKHRMMTDANIKRVVNGDSTWAGRIGVRICQQSKGLPLLAQLHLNHIVEESSKADVEDKIAASTSGLLEEYDQSLDRITANQAFAKLAFRVFSWLIAARRPLSKDELCQALGIGLGDAKLRRDRIPAFDSVLESCLGLVRLNEALNTIEFFHYSIKEHLLTRNKPEEIAVLNVPRSCLVYLQFRDFTSLCQDYAGLTLRQDRYPFASYLAEHWTSHVRGDTEDELCEEVGELLESTNIFSSLQLLPESKRNARLAGTIKDTYSYGTPSKEIALYLCTYLSLFKVLQKAFDKKLPAGVCVSWGELYSPSHVAVCYGDVPMLQEVLMHPLSANCQDRWGLTPLHLAVRLQSTEETALVRALLGSEPDLELLDQDGDTPLHLAASYATVDSIELLLKARAKVNVQNTNGKTPLHRAIERGSLRVTQLFLDHHADPTIVDTQGSSSLGLCLQDPQPVFLDALSQAIDHDGNRYEFDTFEKTTLDGFMQFTEDAMALERQKIECLERERAERETLLRSQYCSKTTTELSWAAEKGAYGGIRRLIRGGADVDKQEPLTGKTPIHHAISNGRLEAVFWLADAGASLDIPDNDRRTPLDYAREHEEILWELYHAGALSQPPCSSWRSCKTTGTTWYRNSERMHLAKKHPLIVYGRLAQYDTERLQRGL